MNQARFSAGSLLAALGGCRVTTFCAPPTVWRMLLQADLGAADVSFLRECVAAGEPLKPEVIEQVRKAWGITVRDGFGQTETTAQVGSAASPSSGRKTSRCSRFMVLVCDSTVVVLEAWGR